MRRRTEAESEPRMRSSTRSGSMAEPKQKHALEMVNHTSSFTHSVLYEFIMNMDEFGWMRQTASDQHYIDIDVTTLIVLTCQRRETLWFIFKIIYKYYNCYYYPDERIKDNTKNTKQRNIINILTTIRQLLKLFYLFPFLI